jgi:multicomponent Na+:H+ antiporter subunit E
LAARQIPGVCHRISPAALAAAIQHPVRRVHLVTFSDRIMPSTPRPEPRTDVPTPARGRARRVAEALVLFGLLLGFWVVLSGRFTALTLGLGVLSAAAATLLNPERPIRLGGSDQEFGLPLAGLSLARLVVYPFVLLGAIAKANLQVAALVLHPRLPIHPAFVRLRTGLVRPLSQVVLANLITVTPGTVTVDLEDGSYLVHALEPGLAADLINGVLPNTVARLLGEPPVPPPDVYGWGRSVQELAG